MLTWFYPAFLVRSFLIEIVFYFLFLAIKFLFLAIIFLFLLLDITIFLFL